MAKSRDSEPHPPVESEEESGEEEGSSSEEENEGSESESEPEPPRTQNSQVTKKPASASVSKKPEPQPSKAQSADSSSDDGETDSETDSDSPIKKPDPNIKPIASKPMDDAQKTPNSKRPRSKPNPSGPTSPAKPAPAAGTKRPSATAGAVDGEAKDAKRSKKKSETGVESSEDKGVSNDDSKKLFQRLWSEDDEIVILQGMIDYRAKRKADPVADLNAFHEFIKKSIHIDVSKTQLQDKIRRLKKKYENNFGKEKKGKEKVSSKPHEQVVYELSKKIWGKESNGMDHTIGSPKANGMAAKRSRTKNAVALPPKVDEREEAVTEDKSSGGEKEVEGLKDVYIGLGSSGIESWIAKNSMLVIKGEKREEMEEKWKKLNVEEVEIYAKKLELMLEQTKFVLGAMKSSEH